MRPIRQGSVGPAGVVDRGKGTGWVAWEPERSHSRPRESTPAKWIAGRTMVLARGGASTRPGAPATVNTNSGGIVWVPEANQISDWECVSGKS
jgi:hypothetical protein